jgi:(p)ppGpp synthase/HD superfamily hydrolase
MTNLTQRFDQALLYASAVHGGQKRKGTDIPYLAHLLGAASVALELGADEDQAIAALLHDAVEDQGGRPRLEDIRARFGDGVAAIVSHCTDADVHPKPPWKERKERYLDSLEAKPADALLVSLSDKIHNAEAILNDLRFHGEDVWNRFTGGRDGSLWYYRVLSDTFERLVPGSGARRLRRAVDALHDGAGEAHSSTSCS